MKKDEEMIGVIIHDSLGLGFSTYYKNYVNDHRFIDNHEQIEMACDRVLVQCVIDNNEEKFNEHYMKTYDDDWFSWFEFLKVEWIPKGTKFNIVAYDGIEEIITEDDLFVAK